MSDIFQQSIRARRSCEFESQPRAKAVSGNLSRLFQGRFFPVLAAAGVLAGIAGCGSNLRPTVTPILGSGPASQPIAYAFVVSSPATSVTANGYGTVIDYAGDTIQATAPIGPGPQTFALNSGGSLAWTVNQDGTVSNIPVSTQLQAKQITYSTLNPYNGVNPVIGLVGGSLGLYALDVNLNQVDVLSGTPDAFKLDVPVDTTPVTAAGVPGGSRFYTISQSVPYITGCATAAGCAPAQITLDGKTVDAAVACNIDPYSADLAGYVGVADGIESATYTRSSQIPLGVCPVYAIGTPDAKRVYVLNRGSDTISVINSQNNAIDSCTCPPSGCTNQSGQTYTCHPTLKVSPASGLAHAGPVYAEYNAPTQQLVVSNFDGNSISIIDVSLDEYGNDSSTFGTTYTVPVGLNPGVGANPASVTVLADGSRAYVANQSDGSVSIVNMASHSIETTLPVTGNPRTVVSIQNSNYGKVYVVSPNSPYITIIRTDQDIISTTVLVQGNAIDARITSPDTSSSNSNIVSRLPGAGQPCFLPMSAYTTGTPLTLANCKARDVSVLTSSTSVKSAGR
jgi:YVTN family beta-propeller protein